VGFDCCPRRFSTSSRKSEASAGVSDAPWAWSPDGHLLAFVRASDDDGRICLVNSNGTHERQLTH
jgi:Tol biopolymer transport system component